MNFSDIQLPDKQLWNQIQQLWAQGQYSAVLSAISNQQLNKKVLTADSLNEIMEDILDVEHLNDPDFKADKIKLARTAPAGMTAGQVYFEWTNPAAYTFEEVDDLNYTFEDIDDKNITWKQVNEGKW